jgi:TolB-like protein/Tfp pilus assembly protein PilF
VIGRTLAHYRVTAALGTGGMGEVYRATDTKLGRDVALKVLPVDVARDPERLARFEREARAIAALNHPHIVTIFSVEEAEDVRFLTMELVEGQSLDRRIPPAGLALDEIVEIAGALADALAAAHDRQIVHRDLKPANVMIAADGRVKVLDFGLAKDLRADAAGDVTMTSAGHTQAGVVMGTPTYMSPEQISGRALDHRTDIFSLGVILHEMATGRRPFDGRSSAELASAILRDAPPPISDVRSDLPADLSRVIRRCLEKDPRQRMQTARDVGNELRDLARHGSHKPPPATPGGSRAAYKPDSGASRADEGFWVAVLPFKSTGSNAELAALAEGLTDDIITGLSRFSYLKVIAGSSTSRFARESVDVRAAANEIGARYVMEGNLRLAGSRLRVTVQLVDAGTGAHLWAETYDRTFQSDSVFELQDELVPRIVCTVADTQGVLAHNMSEMLRDKDPQQLTPYEAVLRSFAYFPRITPQEHLAARSALERAVQQAPGYATAWAMLAILLREECTHKFNYRSDSLARAFEAARRAVDGAPSSSLAYHGLASVLFVRKEFQAFESAARRAVELNPMDGVTIAYVGFLIAYAGDWDRGCELVARARSLNPHHAGWYWLPTALNSYRNHDYRGALDFALKVNMPGFWRASMVLAAIYGQLGETEAARKSLESLLAVRPQFATAAREECEAWWRPDMVDHLLEGLGKAGLDIAGSTNAVARPPESSRVSAASGSGASRAQEGFWVAVLPFKSDSNSADLKSLADGLSEGIVTGLSRFSYLRVIARGSTLRYANQSTDLREVGKELGARYVIEGTLRQAGSKLRIAVQLVDTASGAHLWAETYDRAFAADEIFAIQDEIVPRVVSTVADQYGVLTRSMSETLRAKNEADLTPHEAVLRTFSYFARITPDEHLTVRRILERAVKAAPEQSDCLAMLSMMYRGEFAQGFNPQHDPLGRALATAQRAVDSAPSNHLAYYALATTRFFQKNMHAFRVAAERCIALNPMDGSTIAYLGLLMLPSDPDRGLPLVKSAMQMNPNHPGWYELATFSHAYLKGEYQKALDSALAINLPGYFHTHSARAAAYGQLGLRDAAQKSLDELLALRPDFAATVHDEYAKWYNPEQVEHMIEGLRKAGLDIPGSGR